MKTIIAGSRKFENYRYLSKIIKESGFQITEVVSGGARGVDRLGEKYSRDVLNCHPKVFKADWNLLGKKAGHIRNQAMAEYGDALIAICVNKSRGTMDMIRRARKMGLNCYVVYINYSVSIERERYND